MDVARRAGPRRVDLRTSVRRRQDDGWLPRRHRASPQARTRDGGRTRRAPRLRRRTVFAVRAPVHGGHAHPPSPVSQRTGERHSSAHGPRGGPHDRHGCGPDLLGTEMTAPARGAVAWHRRLEARVVIAAAVIAATSLTAVLYAASRVV